MRLIMASPQLATINIFFATLGFIPFGIGLYLSFNTPEGFLLSDWAHWLASYTLLILAFLSGTLWQHSLQGKLQILLASLSNLIALAAWFGFSLLSISAFLHLAIWLFLFLLFIDYRLYLLQRLSFAYFRLRLSITGLVVLTLAMITKVP